MFVQVCSTGCFQMKAFFYFGARKEINSSYRNSYLISLLTLDASPNRTMIDVNAVTNIVTASRRP